MTFLSSKKFLKVLVSLDFKKYVFILIIISTIQPSLLFAWWFASGGPHGASGPGPLGSWPDAAKACTEGIRLDPADGGDTCFWTGQFTVLAPNSEVKGCAFTCIDKFNGSVRSGDVGVTISPIKIFCPPPFVYSQGRCDAYCETGQVWDATLKRCTEKLNAKTCNTVTSNPINIFRAEKYRAEEIISIGSTSPITLTYYYNNRTNNQLAGAAIIYRSAISRFVAATMAPLSTEEIRAGYTLDFLLKPANPIQNQYRANWYRYWRHNYEEALQFNINGTISWLRSDGEDIVFSSLGVSAVYGSYRLSALNVSEFGYAGYRIITQQNQKIFDDAGKLRRVIYPNGIFHDIEYNGLNIAKIKHSLGGELNFSYVSNDDSLVSMQDKIFSDYPTKITDNIGRNVDLAWNKSFTGAARTYYLLTRYSYPYITSAVTARDFEYNDVAWPVSVTDIYDVSNISNNTRKLYAHFAYDTLGRAISSGLVNGVDAVKVDYVSDLIRVVTNSLGKKATYEFADFSGVKRLKRITGEPTATCVKSEVTYEYDASGNISNEIKNGVTTHREYDSQNREILMVEANGTSIARTTLTEWHPTLNLKSKVTESHSETIYSYDSNGLLLKKEIRAIP